MNNDLFIILYFVLTIGMEDESLRHNSSQLSGQSET